MTKNHKSPNILLQQGFTITELIVAIGLFGLAVVAVMGMMSTAQQAQQSERYLDLANTAVKQIVEEARNGGYDLLVAGQTYDRTSKVSDVLPARSATIAVSSSSDMPDFKRIDVRVNYTVGVFPRHVATTAVIGKGGITQ